MVFSPKWLQKFKKKLDSPVQWKMDVIAEKGDLTIACSLAEFGLPGEKLCALEFYFRFEILHPFCFLRCFIKSRVKPGTKPLVINNTIYKL